MEDNQSIGLNLSSLQCRRCRKHLQENTGGDGTKRYLSAFDVVQGQGNGGSRQTRGGLAQNFFHGLYRVEELGNGRNWVPLELGTSQSMGGAVQHSARGHSNEPGNGKSWTPLDLGTNQCMGPVVQHSAHGHSSEPDKENNWASPQGQENGFINMESPHGQDSSSSEVLSHVLELENQIPWLRGENFDKKKAISHLSTFVQITNSKLRNGCSKLKEYFDVLVGKLENGCPCSADISTQINSLHNNLRLVEAELDNMKSNLRNSPIVLHGIAEDTVGPVNGCKEKSGHQFYV